MPTGLLGPSDADGLAGRSGESPLVLLPVDELAVLQARLAEAEETLDALREGRVDALVVSTDNADTIFTLKGAGYPYRLMIESMQEGALTIDAAGVIIYCNQRFTAMLGLSLAQVLGRPLCSFIVPYEETSLEVMLARLKGGLEKSSHELELCGAPGVRLPVCLTASALQIDAEPGAICMVAMDLSEQKAAQRALQEAEQKYRGIFENAVEGIFQLDADGRYLSANPALSRIYRHVSPALLIAAMNGEGGVPYVEPGRHAVFLQLLRERGEVRDFESQVRCGGELVWISENARTVFNASGALAGFEGSVEDITDRKHNEAQLEYHANFDPLTGLANRHRLQDRLQSALIAAERYGHQITVAFIDLDQFKFINDSLGHHVGDRLLQVISQRLSACLREGDTVARHGGDEFVLVIDHSNELVISQIMPKILASVSQTVTIGETDLQVTCSIGFSLYPIDGTDAATLLRHADAAMYRAKEQGRNNCQFYTSELNLKISSRLAMETNLRNAMARGEFFLVYQPKVDLRSGRIVGVEALVRWKRDGVTVSPAEFIPLAEEIGLIVTLGEWVLRTACAQNKAWQQAGHPSVSVSVNLSARQFKDKNLLSLVAQVLQDTQLEARFLDLELTESMVMQNVDATILTLAQLKQMGVNLSIDDFGTGYSSLSYLKRFPIDVLKIDQSFVRDITTDADDAAIARAIISLAHSLKLKVVAEGVETEAQLAYLQRLHCDEMQGYYFSRPVAPDAFAQLLAESRCLPAVPDQPPPSRPTLLLVDDETNVLASLKRLLRKEDYRILSASSAAEGFRLLALHPVHVILCDQRMPVMNGTEFLTRTKQMYPETIRIILSGHADGASILETINSGAIHRFYTKPWDDELLVQNLREAFRNQLRLPAEADVRL